MQLWDYIVNVMAPDSKDLEEMFEDPEKRDEFVDNVFNGKDTNKDGVLTEAEYMDKSYLDKHEL